MLHGRKMPDASVSFSLKFINDPWFTQRGSRNTDLLISARLLSPFLFHPFPSIYTPRLSSAAPFSSLLILVSFPGLHWQTIWPATSYRGTVAARMHTRRERRELVFYFCITADEHVLHPKPWPESLVIRSVHRGCWFTLMRCPAPCISTLGPLCLILPLRFFSVNPWDGPTTSSRRAMDRTWTASNYLGRFCFCLEVSLRRRNRNSESVMWTWKRGRDLIVREKCHWKSRRSMHESKQRIIEFS